MAFLDDDNYWETNHVSTLLRAIRGFDWAYSNRFFFDEVTELKLCTDLWDSVGPGKGLRKESLNGFVDPNCIIVDKLKLSAVLTAWLNPLTTNPFQAADRRFYLQLTRRGSVAWTGNATVGYSIRRTFFLWPKIKEQMTAEGRWPPQSWE